MELLVFFDYIFYCIARVFENALGYTDKDVRTSNGIVGLSIIQTVNLITILSLIKPKDELSDKQAIIIYFSFLIILIGLNYLRYTKLVPLRTLEKRFSNETFKVKRLKGFGIIFYCLLSVYLASIT